MLTKSYMNRLVMSFALMVLALIVGTKAQVKQRYSFSINDSKEALLAVAKVMGEVRDGRIKKRQFSRSVRVLFIAGLEGTGHHAWKSIVATCVQKGLCVKDAELSMMLMERFTEQDILNGLFGASDVSNYALRLTSVYNRMHELSTRTKEPRLFIIGLSVFSEHAGRGSNGMMSYPSFGGINKPLNNPDVFTLAAVAEAVGLDLRVVVLQRSAAATIRSDMEHRHFGKDQEPRILMVAAEELAAQLSLLDRNFFTCSELERMGEMTAEENTALANYLHPAVVPMWHQMMSVIKEGPTVAVGNDSNLLQDITVAVNTVHTSSTTAVDAATTLNHAYNVMQLQTRTTLITKECSRSE